MAELSSAAQAVLVAIEKFDWEDGHFSREEIWHCSKEVVAAALRAAADQGEIFFDAYDSPVQVVTVEDLLTIAAELEAQ